MNLPSLPRQLQKKEAAFGIKFRRWIEQNPRMSAAYELKQVRGSSMPFSAVEDHQIAALMTVKGKKGLLYKIPDDSRGAKPFDYFFLREEPAYIVIKYPEFFCMIDIETFLMESKRSKRRSLLGSRAQEISTITVPMK